MTFLDWCGELRETTEFACQRAREYAAAAARHPFVHVVEARRRHGCEILIVDVDVELPQHPPVDVRRTERVAIVLDEDNTTLPSVRSLRSDFPDVPHLNLTAAGDPKSLCLFEEPPEEVTLRLTPHGFLERIREWLAMTAVGNLHQDGQALEPFLLGTAAQIIVGDDDLDRLDDDHVLIVGRLSDNEDVSAVLCAMAWPLTALRDAEGEALHIAVLLEGAPTAYRAINAAPSSLRELCKLLSVSQVDVIGSLRTKAKLTFEARLLPRVGQLGTFIIARIPKTRVAGGPVESTDVYAFHIDKHLGDLGVALGIFDRLDGAFLPLIEPVEPSGLADIQVIPMRRLEKLTPRGAAVLSGKDVETPRAAAVGAGALGSQVILSLARQGWNKWTVVDHDQLVPHNLARHALGQEYVGTNKAKSVAHVLQCLLNAEEVAAAIPANVLRPGNCAGALADALTAAEVVIDLSASVAVSRHLASLSDVNAPRVAAFLSPGGRDLVVLSEDSDRRVRLDDIEMQFYALSAAEPFWGEHYGALPERIRFSGACRDVTSRIDNTLFAIHGAIAARFLSSRRWATDAGVHLWRIGGDDEVRHRHVEPSAVTVAAERGWEVRLAHTALDRMHGIRERAIPNETGGVLVGSFDTARQIAYICWLVPSPPDSEEWPALYIRGKAGLQAAVEQITRASGNHLEYVGEWHTHVGVAEPSGDDRTVLGWLAGLMGSGGLPGIMVIVGGNGDHRVLAESC